MRFLVLKTNLVFCPLVDIAFDRVDHEVILQASFSL
jgi:hypothetical protein